MTQQRVLSVYGRTNQGNTLSKPDPAAGTLRVPITEVPSRFKIAIYQKIVVAIPPCRP